MNVYKEGLEVSINVEQLNFSFGNKLSYGTIETDDDYFDLYNTDGNIACMNGEECVIEQVGEVLITLVNQNGEGDIHFTLTRSEADAAIVM